jgi:hypothetical protein
MLKLLTKLKTASTNLFRFVSSKTHRSAPMFDICK